MAFPVDVAANLPTKDYIVAFGHLKLIRNKNYNGSNKRCSNEVRKKTTSSKLCKNINSNVLKKPFQDSYGQTDISDTAGTSKQTKSKLRLEHLAGEDYMRSIMLQRKSNTRKTPTGEISKCSIKSLTDKLTASNQQRNIQRVQLLNVNPDFCREVNSPPKSVASTRPIPTLGQIYQQDPNNDPLLFAGWYLESVGEYSNSFENSVETTSTSTNYTTDACIGFNENGNFRQVNNINTNNINTNNITNVSLLTNSSPTSKLFKTTNENVSEWLSAELDNPTADFHPLLFPNESPLTICYNPISNNNYMVQDHTIQDSQKGSHLTNEVEKTRFSGNHNENSHFFLNNQPTIIIRQDEESNSEPLYVIPKTNTDVKEKDFYPDFHKPLMFHSSPIVPRRRETINKNRTASYVEYPSEVLQKTTNFESDGGDNLSSIVETDHGLSSSWMFNRNTDSSTLSGLTWSKLQISQETLKESFKNCRSWKSDALVEKHATLESDICSNHDYLHHYCWRKEVARKEINDQTLRDYRGRCNKCHKYRLKKMGMMNYLQKSIIWDNANVQTTIFVYHETGTDAVTREQKSAAITASIKLNSGSSYQNDISLTSERGALSPHKHDDVGPSIFPFLRYSSNNAAIFGRYQSKRSSRDVLAGAVKEIRSINTQCSHSFDGGKVAQELVQYAQMKHALSEDAYTQVLITCNNADTNVVFKPTYPKNNSSFSQGLLCRGVDAATDPIAPVRLSQRSMNVMTSTAVLQGLTNNETQVSPPECIWKMSTGILVQEMYRDAKSSVVTDTSVPRRILDATLVTATGKVLTCTGTKITSVSSADIRSPSRSSLSRASRPYTVNTAISKVMNKDRSTTLSLCNCDVEDASLATESKESEMREKSTSQMKLACFTDIGLSASSVVKHSSMCCGSAHMSCSFGAATRPQCHSVMIHTDMATVPKYTSVDRSDQDKGVSKETRDRDTQYSSFIKHELLTGGGSQIGGSRLISVRALLPDAVDDTTQAQPSRLSAETKTLSNQKMSASMLTSHFALEQQFHPLEATLDREQASPLQDTNISSDHNVNIVSPNEVMRPVLAQVSSKPSKRSNSSTWNKASSLEKSKQPIDKTSSHLDGKKWIKESTKDIKDIDSIVKVSENAVSESLHRASLIASSSHKLSFKDIRELSKALLNQCPDVNCVTAKPNKLSTNNLSKSDPKNKDNTLIPETRRDSSKTLTIDKITSDEVVIKDTKECILQAQTNVCDTATDCLFEGKSASVLTSRHVLPRFLHCADNSSTDCLFVYDRPRCIIHNNKVNIAVQIQTEREKIPPKTTSSQHSIAIEALFPCQVCCQRQHGVIGETLTPREYKSLYEATKLIMNDGSDSRCSKVSSISSSFDKTVVNEETNKMTSQMTSCLGQLPAHCCCMRCTQIVFLKDTPLLTDHMNTHSIQTVKDAFLLCPRCKTKVGDLSKDDSEQIEDCVKAHLATSCRYYSNLLSMKLGRVKDNFIKHLAPSIVESIYPLSVPEFYAEACTMKPSGRLDENCQTKIPRQDIPKIDNVIKSSCVLTPTISAMDLRGQDKQDLKTVYYILSGIEGRVRRLKNNLQK